MIDEINGTDTLGLLCMVLGDPNRSGSLYYLSTANKDFIGLDFEGGGSKSKPVVYTPKYNNTILKDLAVLTEIVESRYADLKSSGLQTYKEYNDTHDKTPMKTIVIFFDFKLNHEIGPFDMNKINKCMSTLMKLS